MQLLIYYSPSILYMIVQSSGRYKLLQQRYRGVAYNRDHWTAENCLLLSVLAGIKILGGSVIEPPK
jgi:hypothetical protein